MPGGRSLKGKEKTMSLHVFIGSNQGQVEKSSRVWNFKLRSHLPETAASTGKNARSGIERKMQKGVRKLAGQRPGNWRGSYKVFALLYANGNGGWGGG